MFWRGESFELTAPLPTLMIVPSGIGCSIGGFAGDAIPSARLLAAASGCLITHPNVMNAASLFWNDSRILYVEGYALDRFAAGEIALQLVRRQRVGLILDVGIEVELIQRNLQVLDACKASLGVNVGPVVKTEVPVQICLDFGESGVSWGKINNPEVLLCAGEKLLEAGATAIAVVTRFPDDQISSGVIEYRRGKGADPIAGAEALISHLLVRHLGIPCAHSPAMKPLPMDPFLDPRAASEELGFSFLSCVIVGLSKAPNLVPIGLAKRMSLTSSSQIIFPDDIAAIVAPDGALGGEAVLACLERKIPIIAVKNPSALDVTPQSLGLDQLAYEREKNQLLRASNYLEAAGLLTLLREGINLESLYRPLKGFIK